MARSADRQRGTLTASVRFLARDERVMPGLSARVRFVADPRAELDAGTALTMPSSALVDHNGQSGVFVVRDDVVEFREIRVGARDGGRVEVSSGLRAGELVVAPADADVLRTGLKVRVSGRALP
jgi:multidrug efflux pump subunit AcrA (membrane-fusion protein)